jgi:serine/threonine protein kinase
VNTPSEFGIVPGRILAGNYRVDKFVGSGFEGEVYLVTERLTDARRAAKLFFPDRNAKDKAAIFYARKLERLRDCRIVTQYHHSESVRIKGLPVTVLISEFVEGSLLPEFAAAAPGGRLPLFEALHLLYDIATGLSQMHDRREYHGDLHAGNILVRRRGIHFEVKLVDLYDRGKAAGWNIREDVCDLVRIFYDSLGGRATYAGQPPVVKSVCCGLKRSLIHQRFPTAGHLCRHLDTFTW